MPPAQALPSPSQLPFTVQGSRGMPACCLFGPPGLGECCIGHLSQDPWGWGQESPSPREPGAWCLMGLALEMGAHGSLRTSEGTLETPGCRKLFHSSNLGPAVCVPPWVFGEHPEGEEETSPRELRRQHRVEVRALPNAVPLPTGQEETVWGRGQLRAREG